MRCGALVLAATVSGYACGGAGGPAAPPEARVTALTDAAPYARAADRGWSRGRRGGSPPPRHPTARREWNQAIEIYGMMPLFAEDAIALGITVNGLWGGYFSESPFRQGGTSMYPSDQAQVEAFHAAGLKVSACFDSTSTFATQQAAFPELAAAVELKADGEPAIFTHPDGARSHVMCIHHPAWQEWLRATTRYVVDNRGDMLTLDNFVPFVRGIQLCEGQPGEMPGFHPLTLAAFREFAGATHPEVAALTDQEIRDALYDACPYIWAATTEKPELLDLYWAFLDASNREHLAALTREAHDYARSKGRRLVINANTLPRLVALGAAGDLLADFSAYWPLFDMFAHEFAYDTGDMTPMPRQKLAALYKHAWGISGAPSSFNHLSGGELLLEHFFKGKLIGFFTVQLAEAYAHRQALTLYVYPGDAEIIEFFRQTRPLVDFITSHASLYERARTVLADVALVHPRARRWTSFSGVAQALAESNVQFEAVVSFAGRPLDAATLGAFPRVAVVGAQDADGSDLAALNQYAASGGTLVVLGAGREEVPGLEAAPRVTFVARDVGGDYLDSYQDGDRRLIRDAVMGDASPRVRLSIDDRTVTAVAYRSGGQVVVHLINFDHDMVTDTVRRKLDLSLAIDLGGAAPEAAELLAPGSAAMPLAHQLTGPSVEVTLPELDYYAIVTLDGI